MARKWQMLPLVLLRFTAGVAVVPFDLCVEAEALGSSIDFQSDVERVSLLQPFNHQLPITMSICQMLQNAGRIRLSQMPFGGWRMVGDRIPVGAVIPVHLPSLGNVAQMHGCLRLDLRM
jgi:hypothetical protein